MFIGMSLLMIVFVVGVIWVNVVVINFDNLIDKVD